MKLKQQVFKITWFDLIGTFLSICLSADLCGCFAIIKLFSLIAFSW